MSDKPESTGDPVADALDLVIRERDALRAENERLREAIELAVMRLDGLKDIWGDEAVMCRCRESLRKELEGGDE